MNKILEIVNELLAPSDDPFTLDELLNGIVTIFMLTMLLVACCCEVQF